MSKLIVNGLQKAHCKELMLYYIFLSRFGISKHPKKQYLVEWELEEIAQNLQDIQMMLYLLKSSSNRKLDKLFVFLGIALGKISTVLSVDFFIKTPDYESLASQAYKDNLPWFGKELSRMDHNYKG